VILQTGETEMGWHSLVQNAGPALESQQIIFFAKAFSQL